MEKSRMLLALLYFHDMETREEYKVELYPHHLEKIGFTDGEIAYILEKLEKQGLLNKLGFFTDYYQLTDKGKRLVADAAKQLT